MCNTASRLQNTYLRQLNHLNVPFLVIVHSNRARHKYSIFVHCIMVGSEAQNTHGATQDRTAHTPPSVSCSGLSLTHNKDWGFVKMTVERTAISFELA